MRQGINIIRKFPAEANKFRKEYSERGIKFSFMLLFVDWMLCYVIIGASSEDYFIYRLYEKSWRCAEQFVTERRAHFLINKFNGKAEDQRIMVEDKTIFAEVFSEYTKRKIISSENLSEADFRAFLCRMGRVIIKPADGYNGMNIYILRADDDDEAIRRAYDSFSFHKYTIEEVLEQDGLMREINAGTCNTMRVNVINNKGTFEIQNAVLRAGYGDKPVDNIHAGGVVSQIDISNGIIVSLFCDRSDRRVLQHPMTGTIIIGKKIPSWEKVKASVTKAAKIISRVKYTSWDIAVIKDGDVAIVEGNTYGHFDVQQIPAQAGVWEQYRKYLQ